MKKALLRIQVFLLSGIFLLAGSSAVAYVVVRGVDLNAGGGSSDSVEVSVTLPAGLQIFALPGKPINAVSAKALRDTVAVSGGSLSLITRLTDQGVFEPYIEGGTMDYNLLPGRGYLINNARACTVKFQLEKVSSVAAVNLRAGINIISVPVGGPYTAGSLLTALQQGGMGSQYVVGVINGQFQLYYPLLGTPDFAIEVGKGYIVASGKAAVWTPSTIQSKTGSVPDNSKAPRSLELEQAIASQIVSSSGISNRAPILLAVRPSVVLQNTTSRLTCLDLDGDPVRYSVTPYPMGFLLNSTTGEYMWNVKLAPSGANDLVFSATDGKSTVKQAAKFTIQKPTPSPNLIAYYAMEGNAQDTLGRNSGVLQGAPNKVAGVSGSALEFRQGQCVSLADTLGFLKGLNTFTIGLWMKTPSVNIGAPYQTLFARSDGAFSTVGEQHVILSWTGRIESAVIVKEPWWRNGALIPTQHTLFSKTIIRPNEWFHVAFSFASGTFKLYINGVLEDQQSGLGSFDSSIPRPIAMANLPAAGRYFNGTLDEVSLYNGALTDAAVASLFAARGKR